MRLFTFLFMILMAMGVSAVETFDYKTVDKLFTEARYPSFEYHVESALPGRCVHKFDPEKIKASVILISVGEKGFELAPVTLHNPPVDFFDDMSWLEIFTLFPEVATQFHELVPFSNSGMGVVRKGLLDVNKAEIREHDHYFVIKIFKNDRFFRYCYYQKHH